MKLFDFFYIFIKSNLKIYFSLGLIFLILGFTISASYLYLETIKYVGIRDNLIQLEDSRKSIQVLNEWVPLNKIILNKEKRKSVLNFLEALEDNDDVHNVYTNLEINNNLEENFK